MIQCLLFETCSRQRTRKDQPYQPRRFCSGICPCGKPAKRTKRGLPVKYCGAKCRNKHNSRRPNSGLIGGTRNCKTCDKPFVVNAMNHVFCSKNCIQHDQQCPRCSKTFTTKRNRNDVTYCSRSCASKKSEVNQKWIEEVRRVLGLNRRWQKCRVCGKTCQSRCCSVEHKAIDAKTRSRNRSIRQKNQTPIECKECNRTFTPVYGMQRRVYCSARCLKKSQRRGRLTYGSHEQRARKYGCEIESFDKRDIFKRDNYICGICGVQIDRILRWPDPNSASLDHIVPLSKKGGHTRANCRCACLKCNTAKNDSLGEPNKETIAKVECGYIQYMTQCLL